MSESPLPSISGVRKGPRLASLLIVAVVALVLLFVGYLSGRRGGAQVDDELRRAIAEARQLADKRHWSAPPKRNVRAVLAEIDRRWPSQSRGVALRRELCERLLADALRLKYAGRVSEARQRVRLALELDPQFEVASQLRTELRGGRTATDGGLAP